MISFWICAAFGILKFLGNLQAPWIIKRRHPHQVSLMLFLDPVLLLLCVILAALGDVGVSWLTVLVAGGIAMIASWVFVFVMRGLICPEDSVMKL